MNSEFRNWSDLRVFLAVLREGSTLAASRALGMAQPTVARRIDALEHELGLMLFERDNRGFRPTEAARKLVAVAEAMEASALQLSSVVKELTRVRPIRITAVSGNFSDRFNAILADFSARHPDIAFEFIADVRTLDLKAGEADIALRLISKPPDPDLICRHISTARFTLFGAPSYRDRFGLPSSPDEFRGHRFVSFERAGVPARFTEWLMRYVEPSQIVHRFSEINLMQAAIRSGQGLGFQNLRLVEEEERAGAVIRCFEPPSEMDTEHALLVAPEAWRRAEVKTFTKFFAPRYAALYK